jgi:O-antigen ligase
VTYLFFACSCLFLLGLMFFHSIGPGLVIIAIVPFDAVFWTALGEIGNSVTVILVVLFLVRTSPLLWLRVWLGTRIQVAIAVFALVLLISHAWTLQLHGLTVFQMYAKKLLLFAMVGIVAWSLREVRFVKMCVKVFVIAMALFTLLTLMDYYLGIKILPTDWARWGGEGALAQEATATTAWQLRFRPPGGVGPNQFANQAMLPVFLSLGWFLSGDKPAYRFFALGCGALMTVAVIATVSRSGMASFAVGGLFLLPTVFRFRPTQVILAAMAGALLPLIGWLILSQLGLDVVVTERFSSDQLGDSGTQREYIFTAAVKVFLANPIFGVGDHAFQLHTAGMMPEHMRYLIPHNTYLAMLAERGLVGFVPFAIVLWLALRRLMRNHSRVAPEVEYWRPYFLAAFVAMFLQMNLNDYTWDRNPWFAIAFAAALERYEAIAIQKRRSEQMAQMQSGFDPPAPPGLDFDPSAPPGPDFDPLAPPGPRL